jgi:CIC family chloride channel protein
MAVSELDGAALRGERLKRREELFREERHLLLLRAAVVGLAAGILAVAYEVAVQRAEWVAALASRTATHSGFFGPPTLILCTAGLGALAAYVVSVKAPEAGGSGIPHIKAALLQLRVVRPIPIIIAKFFGGLAALLTGMSFGREGPTVQMGACVGRLIGDWFKVSRRARSSLLAAGAGAGLAAAFNAPLAGFLFVMEELRREMSAITYGSALVASVCAVGVTRYLVGLRPDFLLPNPGIPPLSILPVIAVLGLLCGLGGVLFNKALLAGLKLRSKLKAPAWVVGAIAGTCAGLALMKFPSITGGGHSFTEQLLSGVFSTPHLLLILCCIFFGRLFLTSLSYSTGLPGGIFAPMLVLGAVLGFIFGMAAHAIAPNIGFSNAGFATIGMAALLASSVRSPLTGVVLIVEMTNEYGLLYSLLIAAFSASLLADALRDGPIYDVLMERDLHLSGAEIHPSEEPLLIDVLIEPESRMDRVRVKNLKLPVGAILTTVERESRKIIPGGSTMLQAGDMVTILVEGDKPELSLQIHEAAKGP